MGLLETAELLLMDGADVNGKGGTYGNALQVAVFGDQEEIVCMMQEYFADISNEVGASADP